jgi:hypothetical protein
LIDDFREACILAAGDAAGAVRLPEGVELERLVSVEAGFEGAYARAVFEALLEARCEGGVCPEASMSVRGLGLAVEASTRRAGGTVEVPVRITVYTPRGLARDPRSLRRLLAAVVRRVVTDVAYLLAPGRTRIPKGKTVCVDPGEGLLKLMELLVEHYGIEEGLRRFDEYLEKPGYIEVGGVRVYPREYEVCFQT